MKTTIRTDDFIVHFEENNDIISDVYNSIIDYFVDTEAFSGESIMQSDTAQIEAIKLMAKIADEIIKFKVDWRAR